MGESARPAAAGVIALRRAEPRDLDAVLAIETQSFSDPWSRRALALALSAPRTVFVVAEFGTGGESRVAGYFVLSPAGEEAELLNLAVQSACRQQRVGAALLNAVLAEARSGGARAVYLEVRQSNSAALALYRSAGFEEVGRRKGYYRQPSEDALILRKVLE